MQGIDLRDILEGILVLLFSIGLHEYAHAKAADLAGDDTPRKNGRISLNPLDHFDPVGAMMILFTLIAGFGIGWGKPVPVNPFNFKSPRWDDLKVSIAGPLTNLSIALVFGLLIRFGVFSPQGDYTFFHLAGRFVITNLALAFFNLIPIPPLDGSHVLTSLLPYEKAKRYGYFVGRYGLLILIGMLMSRQIIGIDILGYLIGEPINRLGPLMMGPAGFVHYFYGR